ncbi:Scr1 family TA system antitoxin-like transcriptional regulator [Streptomyces sp. NPDC003032]
MIPALLQTASYARETVAANATTRSPEEIAALAEVRLAVGFPGPMPDVTDAFERIVAAALPVESLALRPPRRRPRRT